MSYRDTEDWAEHNLLTKDPDDFERSGFIQNMQAAARVTINEELMISEYIADAPIRARNQRLDDLIDNGDISKEEASSFYNAGTNRFNYDALAKYMADRGWSDFESDADIQDRVRWDIKEERDKAAEIQSRAGTAGVLGTVVGTAYGVMHDPILWPTVVVGPAGGARAATTAARMARAAGTWGAIAGAEETIIQPFVYQWKNKLGIDYSVGDAIQNIAIVAGAGAGLGAFAEGVRSFIKTGRARGVVDEDDAKIMGQMADEAEAASLTQGAEAMEARTMYEAAENVGRSVQEAPPMRMDTKPLGEVDDDVDILEQDYQAVIQENPDMEIVGMRFGADEEVEMTSIKASDYITEMDGFASKADEALKCMGRARSA